MDPYVIISYSSFDKPIADAVCSGLEARGIRCWISPRDILPGINFQEGVIDAIDNSSMMVVILSLHSNESPHVIRELTRAVSKGLIIVPFRIEDVPLSKTMEYLLSVPHWLDAFPAPLEQHIETLVRRIEPILNAIQPNDTSSLKNSELIHTPNETPKNWVLKSPNISPDNVHFSVASPKTAKPGSNFLLTFWAYLNSQREEVLKRIYESNSRENIKIHYKGPVKIERETLITLFIEIEDLILKQNIASMHWTSEIISESFLVSVPDTVSLGTKIGVISVLVEGIEIAKIHFSLEVTSILATVQSLPIDIQFHQKGFASYSTKDTKEVLSRIQAMEIVAPWLKVYIDFDGIRAGQYWKEELKKSISEMDIFYLFWSKNAAKSDWVKREWLCALNSKGLDYIQPVPLVNPDKVPPPTELSPKQFKDKWLCYIEWQRTSRTKNWFSKFFKI
jgi:hypothetical protein